MSLRTKKPKLTTLAADVVRTMAVSDVSSSTAAQNKSAETAAINALVEAVQKIFPNPVVGNRRLIDLPDGSAVLLYYTKREPLSSFSKDHWVVTRIQPNQRIASRLRSQGGPHQALTRALARARAAEYSTGDAS